MGKLLPASVITRAIVGDPDSTNAVIAHYKGYISYLASRYGYFDVEANCRMESQLLCALFKFKLDRT